MNIFIEAMTVLWVLGGLFGVAMTIVLIQYARRDRDALDGTGNFAVQKEIVRRDFLFATTFLAVFALCLILYINTLIPFYSVILKSVLFITAIVGIEWTAVNACLFLVIKRIDIENMIKEKLTDDGANTTASK